MNQIKFFQTKCEELFFSLFVDLLTTQYWQERATVIQLSTGVHGKVLEETTELKQKIGPS